MKEEKKPFDSYGSVFKRFVANHWRPLVFMASMVAIAVACKLLWPEDYQTSRYRLGMELVIWLGLPLQLAREWIVFRKKERDAAVGDNETNTAKDQ